MKPYRNLLMKKTLLSVLFGLLLFAQPGFTQRTATQRVARRDCRTCPVLYFFTTHVPPGTYPVSDAGRIAFEAAANNGLFRGELDNGAILPAGTRPPRVPPNPQNIAWLQGVRVSVTSVPQLYVEVAGEPVEIKFERADGTLFSASNPDNVAISSGIFYGTGTNGAVAQYTQQARVQPIPLVPLVLTLRKGLDQGQTVRFSYTPVVGASQVILTGIAGPAPPPGPPAPPPSNTPIAYNRVLYVGNSITLHGGSPFFLVPPQNPTKRGMAATAPERDYVRLLSARHNTLRGATVDNRTLASWNMGGSLDEATGPYTEGQLTKDWLDLSRFNPVADWKPDVVYIRLGENVTDYDIPNVGQSTVQSRLKALIDKLISQSPAAKVILSTSVWDKPNYDIAIRAIANERGYPVADFSDMWPNRMTNGYYALNPSIYNDAGTDSHPDDDGHQRIATGLWSVTPQSTTPPPPSNNDFIVTANQPWGGSDMKFIENTLIKVGFRLSTGATINHLSLKADGNNRVNDDKKTVNGQQIVDKGRQVQFGSDYCTPGQNYQVGNDNTNQHGYDTGANPVQGGSQEPFYNPSTILQSGIFTDSRGQVFYARIRPKIWGLNNVDGHIVLEENIWLEGRTVRYRIRHTVEQRPPAQTAQMLFQGSTQENPCLYLTGPHKNFRAQLTPGGSATNVWFPDFNRSQIGPTFHTAGHWIGAYEDSGVGVTLYQKHNNNMGTGYFPQDGKFYGDENGGSSSYLNGAQMMDYDTPGAYDDEGYIILGTESQAMSVIAAAGPPSQAFNFDFSQNHQGWYTSDAVSKRENGKLVLHMSAVRNGELKHGNFCSPARTWQAGNIRKLTIDLQVSAGISQLHFQFIKVGQTEQQAAGQLKTFSINPNGARQTVTVDMGENGSWNQIISSVALAVAGAGGPGNETITLFSINGAAN